MRDEILLRRKKEDGFDFIQGCSLGFHLNEVKISSWLDTISSKSNKERTKWIPIRPVLIRMFNTTFVGTGGLPRFGHARGLTPHRGVIQDPRAASLPRLSEKTKI